MARADFGKVYSWLPDLKGASGPIYLSIVQALAEDIKAGRLKAGDPLPSQRELAEGLGVNFTTVTRAYEEARSRKLIAAKAGQGTYVRDAEPDRGAKIDATISLVSNWPPPVPALSVVGKALADLASEKGALALEYRGGQLEPAHFDAGRQWLASSFGGDLRDRITLSAGARGAFLAIMSQIVGPGAVMLTEALTWPAIKAVARLLGITLIGVETDGEGILPDALQRACSEHRPKALYCTPTIQNPTASMMGVERRKTIAEIARKNGIAIIEDDAYGKLVPDAPPPIAALAPDVVIYVSGLAKTLASGLRIAYVVSPDAAVAQQIAERLRFTMLLPPPVEIALATRLILSGEAERILSEIKIEMKARHNILRSSLKHADFSAFPGGLHAFVKLPAKWSRAEFINTLARNGVLAAPSDSFAISPSQAPNAIRLSIGAPISGDELEQALQLVANLHEREPAFSSDIV
ncbi:PLP-dependent aminotransferase family protein [Bradyrhizobium sp. CCBAU 53421]|uniref:aminotransferase-like domain-containing protein n=1 Tax=Bradyrhizobium sp. CCBAU 53421 TaxID=1325120 RepID=UPI00188D74D6|nr:PLP-dependent aminotransferase family protein [Bradyrhizobium sp. CCBAU 53421]QOZ32791.1 PLP-dependent aminotransferase family protein [Bradyrhizobium sp. CCBAU 53421]